MSSKKYYSLRKGVDSKIDFNLMKELFFSTFQTLSSEGYFQESMGYDCVDAGYVPGRMGENVGFYFLKKLRKTDLLPIHEKYTEYTEEDIFDVIELLYDEVSKPTYGQYHDWADCGWHYSKFNKKDGQKKFYGEINEFLKDYDIGYELSLSGEILEKGDYGFEDLLIKDLPKYNPDKVEDKVKFAVQKFRRYHSSLEERKEAVRTLADVLEYLRPKLDSIIFKKDEADLFNIANNFGIRHHNDKQKDDYDKSIWLAWMFYYYLATIHTIIRKMEKENIGL